MLRITDLSCAAGDRIILDRIAVGIGNGFTCIVGESGAGKSTLLMAAGALNIPDDRKNVASCEKSGMPARRNPEAERKQAFAMQGAVRFQTAEGRWLDLMDPPQAETYRRECLSVILQEPGIMEGVTVSEHLRIASDAGGILYSEKDAARILRALGLGGRENADTSKMSGGERQRAAIAAAFLRDSEIILADEPTGNLDRKNTEQVFAQLRSAAAGRTVIAVTHDFEMAEKYADRIIGLEDGRIVSDRMIRSRSAGGQGVPGSDRNPENLTARAGCSVPGGTADAEENARSGHLTAGRRRRSLEKMLTGHHIRRFRSRFLAMVLTLSAAFGGSGAVYAVKRSAGRENEKLNTAYYDADLVYVRHEEADNTTAAGVAAGQTGSALSPDDVRNVRGSGIFAEVLAMPELHLYLRETYTEVPFQAIGPGDFFRKRIGNAGPEGRFPEKDRECIIGENIADTLFGGEAIGKTLELEDDYGNVWELEVCGINHGKNVDGVYETWIPISNFSEVRRSGEVFLYLEEHISDSRRLSYSEDASGVLLRNSENEASGAGYLSGRAPSGAGETAVSASVAELLLAKTGEKADTESGHSGPEKMRTLFEKQWYLSAGSSAPVRITGVFGSEEETLAAEDSWYDEIMLMRPAVLECYMPDMEAAENFSEDLLPEGLTALSNYRERFAAAVENGKKWNRMFFLVFLLILLLSVLILGSYLKITLEARTGEAGLLMTMGVSAGDLRRILAGTGKALGAVSGIASGGVMLAGLFLNAYCTSLEMPAPPALLALLIPAVVLPMLLCAAMTALPVRRIAGRTPCELIRDGTE